MDSDSTLCESSVTSRFEAQLLGYDVRFDRSAYLEAHWTPERRRAFLLSDSIDWPLSVDPNAWPSYFLDHSLVQTLGSAIETYVKERAIVLDPNADDLRFQGLRLWASLDRMLETYARQKHDVPRGIVVAVRLEHAESVQHAHFEVVLHPEVDPSLVGRDWQLLGYDVADQHLTSSLANLREGRDILRATVGPQLNQHGLFSSRQDALSFRGQSDQLFSVYGPFCVYSLYRIPALEAAQG
jgi:hypothetical protein